MRVVAIIPAYNEGEVLMATLRDVARFVQAIVVVDDGSTDGGLGEGCWRGGPARPPLYLLRHFLNRGQGAALQTGTEFALEHLGADVLLHFDADGQMRGEDIPRLLAGVLAHEVDVALGSRFLGRPPEGMPLFRRGVIRAGVLFTWLLSGLWLTDTHNGFRALSRVAAEALPITLDRMAHASEILDQIVAKGMRFREVAVTIRYTTRTLQKGQKFWGMFRIAGDAVRGKLLR
jgi:glycosyltransferase involved in cell wall biosynthesis